MFLRMRRLVPVLALSIPLAGCIVLHSEEGDPGPPCSSTADPSPGREACAYGPGALAHETIACPASGTAIPIDHVIVLMQENRSFDHYLGHLPEHGQESSMHSTQGIAELVLCMGSRS